MTKVFLVEDDERLSQLTADFLRTQQLEVKTFVDGSGLLEQVKLHQPDVILLDVMLPGSDGFTLCRALRQSYQGPILFLTARDTNFDQVLGLELGADDYVIKPVEPRVLLARIHALLRRAKPTNTKTQHRLHFGRLSIDSNSRQVMLGQEQIPLTSHEFDLLWMLAENASQLVDRERIYKELIGREYDGLDRSADVRISRLRKKLQDNQQNPQRIKTIWGKGFFFVADAWE
ncbi:response regulator [Aliiglaciecola sp. CAU 1673]|uniref:response regulator n=1 Tax=Aliiglaciecola sp. CAU 1673 TaxID=3032595 RepID=UPI0023D98061|nr:response regulator [Aliiglaciecola sp. CAU 1673]MDF2177904.1 response regulator [Aliiglaciecola sp. CAU 1673]